MLSIIETKTCKELFPKLHHKIIDSIGNFEEVGFGRGASSLKTNREKTSDESDCALETTDKRGESEEGVEFRGLGEGKTPIQVGPIGL